MSNYRRESVCCCNICIDVCIATPPIRTNVANAAERIKIIDFRTAEEIADIDERAKTPRDAS